MRDTLTYTSKTEHTKATPCSVSIHAINTHDGILILIITYLEPLKNLIKQGFTLYYVFGCLRTYLSALALHHYLLHWPTPLLLSLAYRFSLLHLLYM